MDGGQHSVVSGLDGWRLSALVRGAIVPAFVLAHAWASPKCYPCDVPFVPDIVVTGAESPRVLLAVEAKTDETQFDRFASEISQYLWGMSSPVGLLIFPKHLWVFYNTYSGVDEKAIKRLGPYELPQIVWLDAGVSPPVEGQRFEPLAQKLLEHLAATGNAGHISKDLHSALEAHVFPALNSGVIRAAGPRLVSVQ